MNTKTIRSVTAAIGVAAAGMAVVVGSYARDRVDLGGNTLAEASITNFVASRDNTSVPEGDYFYEIANLLKREYVEPISDEGKLATGAVRGMVGSLGDPNSIFMDKAEFTSFLHRRQGDYEGIGAEVALVLPPTTKPQQSASFVSEDGEAAPADDMTTGIPRIPKVTVLDVVPGGPADKAGVKPGDTVAYVDGHWVWDADLIVRFRDAQKAWLAKKLSVQALNKIRKEVREKTERDMLPQKARERLIDGDTGVVKVVWNRKGVQRTTTIAKAISHLSGFSVHSNVIRLALDSGDADRLRTAISGKAEVTIDLTHNTVGDFGEMKKCLAILAPSGKYGYFTNLRGNRPQPLAIQNGNGKPPKITLRVDGTTRGAAQVLADALRYSHRATLKGMLATNDRQVYDIVELPNGSGYTLVTALYKPTLPARMARRAS